MREDAERIRLEEDSRRKKNWKRWGPYLSERQWGTVREDYSKGGDAWNYFGYEQSTSRAYRWGEDGLLGMTDRQCRLCFAFAFWNEKDDHLKERLFGLTGPEGNHGEDVKELYYYLESSPTHSYFSSLYKYPQDRFPYDDLRYFNSMAGLDEPEFELVDTGVFDENRYFDIKAEYAKNSPNDILIRLTVVNRGPDPAPLHILPTLWFRNTWIWGCHHEGCSTRPEIMAVSPREWIMRHHSLGRFRLRFHEEAPFLFTENLTNSQKLFGDASSPRYTKDAFHRAIIYGDEDAVRPEQSGTKGAAHYRYDINPGRPLVLRFRLSSDSELQDPEDVFGNEFISVFRDRADECRQYFGDLLSPALNEDQQSIALQAYAGLLHSKQFYHYSVYDWLEGDRDQPSPPPERMHGRNHDWEHFFSRDLLSVPDKWEYPWFAAWDSAFHMIPFARVDPDFAKSQLVLLLREWYLHPNGQIPAYEWNLSDVNPPVHAWAVWRVYKMAARRGSRDLCFLAECFHKLLLNFTWWVNRKDPDGRNLFSGGFLGLDNIGPFDRSSTLEDGASLEQADGTAWMAFYCSTMLAISMELAAHDSSYEGMASKFFEHFVAIAETINKVGDHGLWDEADGFYYDQLRINGDTQTIAIRSLVGLIPLCAVEILDLDVVDRLPQFKKRMQWFFDHTQLFRAGISCMEFGGEKDSKGMILLAIPSRQRLVRVLQRMLDEGEFLSRFGIRSLSRYHLDQPYFFSHGGQTNVVKYAPAESDTYLFGGNSNWRGPIWFPLNYLLIESLERYHHFYSDSIQLEFPTGSGRKMNLLEVSRAIGRRLVSIFEQDRMGERPVNRRSSSLYRRSYFADNILFYEYFDGDNGQGLGASHQTGWTALVAKLLEDVGR